MKGRAIVYSAEELAFVEARREMERPALHAAFLAAFGRDDVSVVHITALCKRRGWLTGRDGRFEKGMVPINKGQPCAPGKGGRHPNARKHYFRKGDRKGAANNNWKPLGTERVSKDGYRERKVNDAGSMRARWRAVHVIEWEARNGPVPAGHALKSLDGDRLNTDPDNWVAVPRALLPRLNGRFGRGYDGAPPELKPTILAIAKLEHRAREATDRKRDAE